MPPLVALAPLSSQSQESVDIIPAACVYGFMARYRALRMAGASPRSEWVERYRQRDVVLIRNTGGSACRHSASARMT